MRQSISPILFFPLTGLLCLLPWTSARAQEKQGQKEAFFEKTIRPLLYDKCLACHADKLQAGNVRLDSRADLLKSNASGAVVLPGEPDKSLLIHVIQYDGKIKMPPSGKLKAAEIAALTTWVKNGAIWPEAEKGKTAVKRSNGDPEVIREAKQNFWAYRPVKKVAPPRVKNSAWVRNPIDAFVLAKLDEKGLKPAPAADRRTLIRRVSIDLIGLPPTPKEVSDFLADKSPNAYEKVVDRLLANPHYGERWGRHWLDVVRYADSNGLDENLAYGNAWRYRDYVVNAFNKDKPYSEFLSEQLAGDLMPTDNEALRNERLTATGFLCMGPKVLAEQDKPKMVMDIVDEQIEVTTKAFMGLTVACARCHDHKFDPIPTRDYYALAGVFKSTRTMQDLGFVSRIYQRPLLTKAIEAEKAASDARLKVCRDELKAITDKANGTILADLKRDAAKYLRAGWELSQQPELHSIAETPVKPDDPKRIIVEAEKFDRGNVARDFETYGKGIGVIHNINVPDEAEWDIFVPHAGTYQIEARYASGERRPVRLLLNGKLIAAEAAAQVTGSFQPEGQKWEAVTIARFQAGKNTLRLESATYIPHFDKFLIVPMALAKGTGEKVRTLDEIASAYHLYAPVVKRWADILKKGENSPLFYPFVKLAAQLDENPTHPATIAFDAKLVLNSAVREALSGVSITSLDDLAGRYGKLFAEAEKTPALKPFQEALYADKGLLTLPEKPETLYPMPVQTAQKAAEEALKKEEAKAPKIPLTLAVEDGKAEDVRIHLRGNTLTLGDVAPRKFLAVLDGDRMPAIDDKRSGRMELAQWLTRPEHPLTARVAINRIWQEHFGEGLVRTPDNWGLLGEKPTHPELLDWLASTFSTDWSMKKMHRLMLLSNTYKQSVVSNPKGETIDPDNRLLWHRSLRRMEAEPFRDSLIFVAGKLDLTIGGSLLTTNDNDYVTNDQSGNSGQYGSLRRSIYLPIIRNALFDMFIAFDMGDPSTTHAKRASTTVAPQALYVMNNPFVLEQTKAFAESLLAGRAIDDNERVNTAYLRAFSRPATSEETARTLSYLKRFASRLASIEKDPVKRRTLAWQSFCQILFASNEFIYVN